MGLLIWLAVGAICGVVWSRVMANSSLADIAAGAAGGIIGGLVFSMLRWASGALTVGDIVGPAVFALVGLAAWRVVIGRRV